MLRGKFLQDYFYGLAYQFFGFVRCTVFGDSFILAIFGECRCDELEPLCNLLFWQEVTEYERTNTKTVDKKAHTAHTWDIYNKYIAADSLFNIGM